MALQVINLTDTFDQWRVKNNLTAVQFGDLSALSTTNKDSLVAAINEIFSNDSDDMENVIDDLTPELGGDLDVLTRSIVSSSNRNIAITPNGTGLAVITKGSYSGKLGASLDVNGNAIVSLSNGNITITPHGTGNVVITKGDYTGSLNTATTAATQLQSDNSTKLATTAWAKTYADAAVASEDTLAEMNDTTISGLANLNVLQYNSSGSTWENKTLTAAGIPTTGFTVAMAIALG